MDPISTLAAAATVTQLATQLFTAVSNVIDVCKRFQEAPEVASRQLRYIDQLYGIVQLILKNTALHTVEIRNCLQCCLVSLSKIERKARKITESKLHRLGAALTEDTMAKVFDSLVRDKVSLLLCIATIDTGMLHSIGITISKLQDDIHHMSVEVRDSVLQICTTCNIVKDMHSKLSIVETGLSTVMNSMPATVNGIQDIKHEIQGLFNIVQHLAVTHVSPRQDSSSASQKYFMVPNRRTRNFVGRDNVLLKIDETRAASRSDIPIVIFRGMGGQGKSQVALHYCFDKRENPFDAIFWLDATTAASLKGSFESVYGKVKSPEAVHSTQDEKVDFVLDWLAKRETPWLLVFDNHNKLDFRLQDYFPRISQRRMGFLIVTTRSAALEEIITEEDDLYVDLQVLDDDSAVELLLKTSARKDEDSKPHAHSIVAALGNHALAIVQAGSYIKKKKINFRHFLEQYKFRKRAILETTLATTEYRRKLRASDNDRETELSVFTTWELSFQQLVEEEGGTSASKDSVSVMLITFLACFDNQDISELIFQNYDERYSEMEPQSINSLQWLSHFKDMDNKWNTDRFREVLDRLTNLSLLQSWDIQDDGFAHATIHPLVRDWILLRTPAETNTRNMIAAWLVLGSSASFYKRSLYDDHAWSLAARRAINKHIIVVLENETETGHMVALRKDLALSQQFCARLLLEGNLWTSLEMLSKSAIRILGVQSSHSTLSIEYFVTSLRRQSKYAEAKAFLDDALRVRGSIPDTSTDDILYFELWRGVLLWDLDEHDEAEALIRDVVARAEVALGLVHITTIRAYTRLSSILEGREDFQAAEEFWRKACDASSKLWGTDHVSTMFIKGKLGIALRTLGQSGEALALLDEALEVCTRLYGDQDLNVLLFKRERDEILQESVQESLRLSGM